MALSSSSSWSRSSMNVLITLSKMFITMFLSCKTAYITDLGTPPGVLSIRCSSAHMPLKLSINHIQQKRHSTELHNLARLVSVIKTPTTSAILVTLVQTQSATQTG
jgi:hypothetical protein